MDGQVPLGFLLFCGAKRVLIKLAWAEIPQIVSSRLVKRRCGTEWTQAA